ncbi:GT4 family glycosyltransferase PelF [Thalassobaculum sp. OXR-137]|uniref:GT4 family glycosyltransferase PelF n=1 Tax=Thalassobaculum sp. OXR-137 TaxID=3100173 RepID=UPI002AC93467|nr:GT4 family glycosyltransferase PelF [Thalassobaculum sp. OXR-137]WPZ33490.1 GT4 family glycosyltransferase PelF [Thalassobaculum sp. OXR-137]
MSRAALPEADVCLILEGSYPYVAGGVSTWTHDLIKAQAPMTFSIVALTSDDQEREMRYELPDNVVGVVNVPLRARADGPSGTLGAPRLIRELTDALISMRDDTAQAGFRRAVSLIADARGRLGTRLLMNSPAAWEMITAMYREDAPESSFLEYFWTWRALFGGLFATLLCDLPRARVYHTISTGYAGLVAARAAMETGRPAVLTEHGIYTNERRIEITMAEWLYDAADSWYQIETPRWDLRQLWMAAFQAYARVCYESCTAITTLYGGNQILQRADGAPPERMRIIPNGIDVAHYSALVRDSAPRRPTVALIGRVVPIKDIKTYIRAADVLRKTVPDVLCWIMGPADEDKEYAEECFELVRYLGLEETVVFLGRVKIAEYLGRVDVLALTSISEAQPLVILEAGAAGVPTVATDVGACREMIEGHPDEAPALGAGGEVVPLSSPNAAAAAMGRLLIDPDWWRQCSDGIRRRTERYYNKREIDRIYGDLYRDMMARPDGSKIDGKENDGGRARAGALAPVASTARR